MKKKLILLFLTSAVLLASACGGNDDNGNGYDNGNGNGYGGDVTTNETITGGDVSEPNVYENSPGAAVSAFFRYLANGNVNAADAIFVYSDGDFADMAEDMREEIGAFIFQNISYSNLVYTIDGNNATATFDMQNIDFIMTSIEAGLAIAEAGLVDLTDPNFEALIEDLAMPMIGDMIANGTAPTFDINMTIELRLIDNTWRINDNDIDFGMALLGIAGL